MDERNVFVSENIIRRKHISFPRIDLPAITDTGFRNRGDPDHHKEDTPLEKFPVDLVADFPVADSLHLIDLVITIQCLIGWIQGRKGTEFGTFLSYVGPVVLTDFLATDVYNLFLMLFCVIVLCSWKE
ncbi:hypothetical protein JTB14_033793 [Gonioctena quinquepunctata]|nr:hypothetical protein JTB14_033793 [Gonioctena quinquepunctata]